MNRTLAALLFLAFFSPAALPAAPPPDPVLARVGDEPVTATQLEREFTDRHAGHARFLGGESEVREFLDKVIDRRLLLQEAYRLGSTGCRGGHRRRCVIENKVEWLLDRRSRRGPASRRRFAPERTTPLPGLASWSPRGGRVVAVELRASADFGGRPRALTACLVSRAPASLGDDEPGVEAVFALAPARLGAVRPSGWQLVRLEALERREA